jgi:hypothetical protein
VNLALLVLYPITGQSRHNTHNHFSQVLDGHSNPLHSEPHYSLHLLEFRIQMVEQPPVYLQTIHLHIDPRYSSSSKHSNHR